MKCIKSTKKLSNMDLGTVVRVKDDEAKSRVDTGNWKYVPKSEWKVLR